MTEDGSKEGWINGRHLILDEPGQDYAIAFSNDRKNFKTFIEGYIGKSVLDLACGHGEAVADMRVMGIDAVGVDMRPSTSEHLIQSSIEDASSNPDLKGRKFPLAISVQGFGVYVSDRTSPEEQLRQQFESVGELVEDGGLLVFTTTGGSENVYGDYHGKPVPPETLFEVRYIDNPTPQLNDSDKVNIPLLQLAKEAGFEHVSSSTDSDLLDQKQVVMLRYKVERS